MMFLATSTIMANITRNASQGVMEPRRQSSGSTPKITFEHPYEELKSPRSVSSSSSSSPSVEFSFAPTMQPKTPLSASDQLPVDLSPADDIFFYGHLLPLHLFPPLPISARSSSNSLDSFTLPATEFMQNQSPLITEIAEPIRLPKSKSFAFFKRWRRSEIGKAEDTERKKKFRFELRRLLKRYARLVRPILMFSERRSRNMSASSNQLRAQPISYSGDLSFRGKHESRGKRGGGAYCSAPASIRTSPVNSGILLTTGKRGVPSPVTDSTMEELQSAIQAAIAHCKNSIATECNK